MKKMLSLLLLVCVTVTLFGCGKQEEQTGLSDAPEGFSVGYSIVDITPKESVPLAGFGVSTKRMANDVLYPLKATCLALSDESGYTVLLYECDLIKGSEFTENARLRISAATGVPESQIMIGCSHTHAGPDLGCSSEPSIINYIPMLMDQLEKAGVQALEDRKTAEAYYGSAETENLNFVRHYQQLDDNGNIEYFGDNYGQLVTPNETATHMTEADPTLHVVKFTREGEKDIVLCNFRAHPSFHGSSSKYSISADYIGAFREAMEIQNDCNFMYVQGACGNINHSTRAGGESSVTDCEQYAALLAGYAAEAMANMTKAEGSVIKTKQMIVDGTVNHSTDGLLLQARNIQAVWSASRDVYECIDMGAPYGIRSPFHANAIASRANLDETEPYELNVITIGDSIAIAAMPFELFDTLSVQLEEQSPYDQVILMGYTNKHIGYLPSAYAFEYTSYETDICRYVAGTGEIVVDDILQAMEELYNS